MAAPVISAEAQVRYLVQWFEEWSELQRADFLPILAEKIAANGTYVNGIVNSMNSVNCQDKPMNLFQCRVKLFNDWFTNWTNEDRDKLVQRITEMDDAFGKRLQEEITGNEQVIDGEPTLEDLIVSAQPGLVTPIENGECNVEPEVENREVVPEQDDISHNLLAENNIPIEITAE